MRVAYLIHSLHRSGGIERVLSLKAGALAARDGFEVWIVTFRQRGRSPFFPLDPRVKTLDLGVNDKSPLGGRRLRRRLDAALERIRPDVTVSLCGRDLYQLSRLQHAGKRMAEFHFSHSKFHSEYGGTALGRLYAGFRLRRFTRAASLLDCFVVLTRADRDYWQERLRGVDVRQIYNPLTFQPEQAAALEAHRCVAVGRLEYQKNFSALVRAWSAVHAQAPDWTLDIFGEGSYRKALERLIAAAGLTGTVHLRGHSRRIPEELLSSSCVVMSSWFEGFPMILLEAAACGVPMVSFDCPHGPAELIRDGENGYLVRLGDTQALSQAILRVIGDGGQAALQHRRRLGAEARRTSEAFTLGRTMDRWEALLHAVAGRRA